mmetsp:Transcript_65819/g.174517  ORF Transcript_65819/g.174517 Transcript_65819/m.174517 type:complete len:246 (+) Transcript_65819:536-1273(+)
MLEVRDLRFHLVCELVVGTKVKLHLVQFSLHAAAIVREMPELSGELRELRFQRVVHFSGAHHLCMLPLAICGKRLLFLRELGLVLSPVRKLCSEQLFLLFSGFHSTLRCLILHEDLVGIRVFHFCSLVELALVFRHVCAESVAILGQIVKALLVFPISCRPIGKILVVQFLAQQTRTCCVPHVALNPKIMNVAGRPSAHPRTNIFVRSSGPKRRAGSAALQRLGFRGADGHRARKPQTPRRKISS